MHNKKPVLLCILDGWGIGEDNENNTITQATLPNWNNLWHNHPKTLLNASEQFVGLPKGQMGNSEVGHMNIGSGRPVRQLLPRINESIDSGEFAKNIQLQQFITSLKQSGGDCHLLGIASNGGVHGHIEHIKTLMNIFSEASIKTWLHMFTDGRDVEPNSALESGFINDLQDLCDNLDCVNFATVGGRYYGMDRDNNWDRVEHSYNAMTAGVGFEAHNAVDAVEKAYMRGESDEFIKPSIVDGYNGMAANDGVMMTNYRPDRARQIMQAFTMQEFNGFKRKIQTFNALGVADYWSEDCPLTVPAMFLLEKLQYTLGEVIADANLKQLRIAETEKYNHVTYFLSGANSTFTGEERILIPSPKVATYDLQPEMSAYEVTEKLVEAINSSEYDFIAVNYANPDMVGHTGNMKAAIEAIEAVDKCLGNLCNAITGQGGIMLITADHGNVEIMQDKNGKPHTQHTTNLVPLIAYGYDKQLNKDGALCDIAPTIIDILGIEKPKAMTGKSLIKTL